MNVGGPWRTHPELGELSSMEVRELSTLEEIAEARALITRIWQAPSREEVPAGVYRAMTWHGNPLLGAVHEGRLAGVSFGFWGRDQDGTVWLYSSKLGVDEHYRGSGLAEKLKREQARWASSRGVGEIRWTFDPMRGRNARFNLHKLGATSNSFIEDLHGPRRDRFNAGERTDRLMVVWRFLENRRKPGSDVRRVALPRDLGDLDPAARAVERNRVRDALREAFAEGYTAIDFDHDAYLLSR